MFEGSFATGSLWVYALSTTIDDESIREYQRCSSSIAVLTCDRQRLVTC